VEARNFDARKNVLKFDDVMNDQRKVIFEQRIELMHKEEVGETVADMRREVVELLVADHIPPNAYAEQWDTDGLQEAVKNTFGLDLPIPDWAKEEGIADQEIRERLLNAVDSAAARKAAEMGPELMRHIEKEVLLRTLDHLWREHIINLEHLRQGVGLRGYAQRDPLNEYKAEAFTLFETLISRLREAVTAQMMRVEIVQQQPDEQANQLPYMEAHKVDPLTGEDAFAQPALVDASAVTVAPEARNPNDPTTWGKVGRNEACPCGSGKKYKHCHGRFA